MIDVLKIVLEARSRTGGPAPILAAAFDLPGAACQELHRAGHIAGYIADRADGIQPSNVPIAGAWIDRPGSSWQLKRAGCGNILFIGSKAQISARMLLAARLAGIHNLHIFAVDGLSCETLSVTGMLLSRIPKVLARRALQPRISKVLARRALQPRILEALVKDSYVPSEDLLEELSYERAFRELIDVAGDSLHLKPDEIIQRRALLLLGSLGPGGAERQAAFTAMGLASGGQWQPVVGCSYLDDPVDGFHRSALAEVDIEVRGIATHPPEMQSPQIQAILERVSQNKSPDVRNLAHAILAYACFIRSVRPALVQTWMDYCNVLAGVAAEIVGIPALVLMGRSAAPDNFEVFQPYMRDGYLELLARRPIELTNNSSAGAADYARWLGLAEDRIVVLRNGFKFPDQSPADRAQALRRSLDIPENAAVMGTLIRYSEEKQPGLWLETAEAVAAKHSSAHFVGFGDGPLLAEIRDKAARSSFANRIHLPGLTRDPWAALSTMDVFVLTSRLEGLPNVLVEAQAMGVPVVTTGRGGMTETYIEGKTGLTASTATADELAAAVLDILGDPDRRQQMSAAAWDHARHEFNLDQMVSRTLSIFDRATNSQPH